MISPTVRDCVERIVLADVGGTNVRFAVLTGDTLGPIDHMAVRDHAHFADALSIFMARQIDRSALCYAIIAAAGVVEIGRCALTNNSWVVDAAELRARFGLAGICIINDFEAIAWALPHLTSNDLLTVGGRDPMSEAPMVALGPGTGFGVAAYLPCKAGGFVLPTECGHMTMVSGSSREDAIIANLRQRLGQASTGDVLSGRGIENIYRAIASIDSLTVPERTAAEISKAAIEGTCATSYAALDIFCAMLGAVAGDIALSFGAQGGVFITGGIVTRIYGYLLQSRFRSRFEAKGRMSRYIEKIPVYVILCADPAFIACDRLRCAVHGIRRAIVLAGNLKCVFRRRMPKRASRQPSLAGPLPRLTAAQ